MTVKHVLEIDGHGIVAYKEVTALVVVLTWVTSLQSGTLLLVYSACAHGQAVPQISEATVTETARRSSLDFRIHPHLDCQRCLLKPRLQVFLERLNLGLGMYR